MSLFVKVGRAGTAVAGIGGIVIAATVLAGVQPGRASDEPYLKKFLACDNFSNPANRAACFEAALQEYYADHPNAEQAAPSADAPAASETNATEIAQGPAEVEKGEADPRSEDADLIIATIATFSRNPLGRAILELDNGQTWVQTDGRRIALSAGDAVEISQNFAGGYKLAIRDRGTFVRVRRVK